MTRIPSIKKSDDRPTIAIVSFPWASPGPTSFVADLMTILGKAGFSIVLSGAEEGREERDKGAPLESYGVRLHYAPSRSPLALSYASWIAKCIYIQVRTILEIITNGRRVSVILFYMSFPYQLPALVVAKLMGIPTVEVVTRSALPAANSMHGLVELLNCFDFSLLDRISLESPSLKKQLPLHGAEHKLTEYGYRFVDSSYFSNWVPYDSRAYRVGFIGRLDPDKGIFLFLEAASKVLKDCTKLGLPGTTFVVCGSGIAEKDVRAKIQEVNEEHEDLIEFLGWVPHTELAETLNELRVLVLPSFSEGLPSIVLESMACGVVVLAPPSGGLPDVIVDSINGHLKSCISPSEIADEIVKILIDSDSASVSKRAVGTIAERFSLDDAVARFRGIVEMTLYGEGS